MNGSLADSGQRPPQAGASLAVIGAGVSGCALAAGLRRGGWPGAITLWEAGRGPGGRAATRRSSEDGGLRIDHGAPLLNLVGEPFPELVLPLLADGRLVPWREPAAVLGADGALGPAMKDPLLRGALFRGRRGMDDLCRGLLDLAESAVAADSLSVRFGILVRQLEPRPGGGWLLRDGAGALLAETDWLVLSGTLLAHPRARRLFGWSAVPLRQAADVLGDRALDRALDAMAAMAMEARLNLLLTIAAADASPWLALPFRLLGFDAAAQRRWGLRRLSIQPLADGRCAVVAHSSAAFAEDALTSETSRSGEDAVMASLERCLVASLAPWLGDPPGAEEGLAGVLDRRLMRWGAAFPVSPGLPAEAVVCPASRVAFCGDWIDGPGWGRIEGALRSAQLLAGRLLALLLVFCLGVGVPAVAATAAGVPYQCDGDLLLALADNGPVDAAGIPNTTAGTVPGAMVVLEWRGLHLQLPRTNNAGPPSYTDGIWWWNLEDPEHPRFLHRRGAIRSFSCRAVPSPASPADGH